MKLIEITVIFLAEVPDDCEGNDIYLDVAAKDIKLLDRAHKMALIKNAVIRDYATVDLIEGQR